MGQATEGFQLIKVRPGHYAKVVEGEIIGMASEGEVFCYTLRFHYPTVDAGAIEIALAISAVSAVFSASSLPVFWRFVAGLIFLLGGLAALSLCWVYIIVRIPITMTHYLEYRKSKLESRSGYSKLYAWLFWHIPKSMVNRYLRRELESNPELAEMGYVFLWISVCLLVIVSFFAISLNYADLFT